MCGTIRIDEYTKISNSVNSTQRDASINTIQKSTKIKSQTTTIQLFSSVRNELHDPLPQRYENSDLSKNTNSYSVQLGLHSIHNLRYEFHGHVNYGNQNQCECLEQKMYHRFKCTDD